MQLVAYGAQDVYLTGSPQITFFKSVYRRHTNFAVEAVENTFQGNPDFGKKVSVIVSRNGDLHGRGEIHRSAYPSATGGHTGSAGTEPDAAENCRAAFRPGCQRGWTDPGCPRGPKPVSPGHEPGGISLLRSAR